MTTDETKAMKGIREDTGETPPYFLGIAPGRYSELLYVEPRFDETGFQGNLRCIECGYTCVGVHRVFRICRDDFEATRVELLDSQYFPREMVEPAASFLVNPALRGDSLAIEFRCEAGHWWILELGNHKGVTVASLVDK